MQRQLTADDDPEVLHHLRTAQKVFYLVTHQWYRNEREDRFFRRWLEGDRTAPRRCIKPWIEQVVAPAVADGRVVRRVQVVLGPVDPFMTFRLNQYRYAFDAGEDIRVVGFPRAQRWPHGMAPGDLLLMDDTVHTPHYEDGWWQRAELSDEPEALAAAQAAERAALGHAYALGAVWPGV